MSTIISHNQYLKSSGFTESASIQQICQPLEHLGIQNFIYFKLYPNGEFVDLFADPYWAELYFNKFFKQEYSHQAINEHCQLLAKKLTFIDTMDTEVLRDGKHYFDYMSAISFAFHQDNFRESFIFLSKSYNKIAMESNLEFSDALKHFTIYFKNKATKIIYAAEKEKLKFPSTYLPQPIAGQQTSFQDNSSAARFLNATPITTFELKNDAKLTKREIECACWLSSGKTINEIAEILCKSPRTIEHHITSVKEKLNCAKATEIPQKLNNTHLKFLLQNFTKTIK